MSIMNLIMMVGILAFIAVCVFIVVKGVKLYRAAMKHYNADSDKTDLNSPME